MEVFRKFPFLGKTRRKWGWGAPGQGDGGQSQDHLSAWSSGLSILETPGSGLGVCVCEGRWV